MIRNAAKYDHINFKPPQSVADEAEKGLEYRKKANPSDKGGLTPAEAAEQGIGSGVQRATNLKNRNNVSPEVIRQMCAFFARHEKNKSISPENKSTPWKDKGHVAWLLWGGDSGKTWAEKVRDQMDRADEKAESKTAHSLIDHELVNDLASAYRGKRMRDGIRDMEMAGMPEQVAERFYDTLGEHADEVRGELHRLIEDKGGCDCGCGSDCPCMKQRVANRYTKATHSEVMSRDDITSTLWSIDLGAGGSVQNVKLLSPKQGEWLVEPTKRKEILAEGLDKAVQKTASAWLDRELGNGLLGAEVDRQGYVFVFLSPAGKRQYGI